MIIAIDPGKDKCGIAVMDSQVVYFKAIIERNKLVSKIKYLRNDFQISEVVIGGSTTSAAVFEEIRKSDPSIKIEYVPEAFSSEEARKRYFKENPPRGILKFIPTSLLSPPRPIDDYAAVILGERYLNSPP